MAAEHVARRPGNREVQRPGHRGGKEEEGPHGERHGDTAARRRGVAHAHLLEMKDQGVEEGGAGRPRDAEEDSGRMTAAMRSRCVLMSRRTGTPEAASSRMSAPDSSILAR